MCELLERGVGRGGPYPELVGWSVAGHAGRVEEFTLEPASGRTAVAYNVTLRRVR
jgi:hypothetical protein